MSLGQELSVLKRIILRYVLLFVGVFFICMAGSVQTVSYSGYRIPLIVPGTPSIATQIFLSLRERLIPADVSIVTLGPVAPFVTPIVISLLITVLLTFPVALLMGIRYLQAALYPHERKTLLFSFFPSLILFYGGAWFAFAILIPQTFSTLYAFAAPLGVQPYFDLADFLSAVFLLVMLTGGVFLLPLFMYVLTKIHLIPAAFWQAHWRAAVLITIIFSAIVTPDGSGVTMLLLSLPILVLYGLGLLFAKISES